MGVAGLAVLLLAGCGGQAAPGSSADAEESTSISPVVDEVYRCLLDKGWDVTLLRDGGIQADSSSIPAAQESQYDADSEECWGHIEERIESMTTDQIVAVYRDELKTRECLIAEGYSVSEPPSEQAYIDSFHGDRWMAYGAADFPDSVYDDDTWYDLNVTCPQPSYSLGAA